MKKLIASVLCGVVMLAVCVWFAVDHIPPQSDPVSTQATGTTTYYENFFLPTEPSMWFSVGEQMDWNGIFTFCVEELSVQKTLPTGFQKEDFRFVNRVPKDEHEFENAPEWFEAKADDAFTLTSDHLYITLTLRITCTGTYPNAFFGLENEEQSSISIGNCVIGEYDTATQTIVREHRLACYRALDPTFHQGSGLFELRVGDSTTATIAYVVRESQWNNRDTAMLFTPMHAHYDVFNLKRLEFDLPQIWLNEQ